MNKGKLFVVDIGAGKITSSVAICAKGNKIIDIFSESTKRDAQPSAENFYTSQLGDIITVHRASLEKKSNLNLQQVFVNIGSPFVSSQISRATVALAEKFGKRISLSDIKNVRNQARLLGLKIDEEIIHEFPIKFILDSKVETLNPIGKSARSLEVELLLVTSKTIGIERISNIIAATGMKLKKVFFSGLASAISILGPKTKINNVAVIDIGALTTKIVFFSQGMPSQIKIIPFAGNNITDGVSSSLKLVFDLAEELKINYGSVTSEQIESEEDILLKLPNAYKPIRRREVCLAMLPKVEKLIYAIKEVIDQNSKEVDSVFVCGGSALLDGFLESLENKISRPVIMGMPYIDFLPPHKRPNFLKSPAQVTLVGLLILALGKDIFKPALEKPDKQMWLGRFFQKAKEVYSDYF
ncbi:MAG: cell division FtsA domain-containing protein [Candidatus Omnitrophota bacterium]